jgi:hypothetical protein
MGTPRLPPFAIVLRLSGLNMDQEALENYLDFEVQRFEPGRNSLAYSFPNHTWRFRLIPHSVTKVAGDYGIDIEFSVYSSSDGDT